MHARTIEALKELDEAAWFSAVGKVDTQVAIVLDSWDKAIESCSSLEWQNLCLEAANQYCERLMERSVSAFSKWNDIVDEIKPVTMAFVARKVERIVKQENLPKVFQDMVHWDILHLCMESEYAEIYPPGFYGSQAYWYVKGHFPCGWSGTFPDGKLIIY